MSVAEETMFKCDHYKESTPDLNAADLKPMQTLADSGRKKFTYIFVGEQDLNFSRRLALSNIIMIYQTHRSPLLYEKKIAHTLKNTQLWWKKVGEHCPNET